MPTLTGSISRARTSAPCHSGEASISARPARAHRGRNRHCQSATPAAETVVDSVRLGAQAYVAAGTTSLYEGHGLTPTVIRAYRENAERDALPLRMHTPISMPSAAFDDKRLLDLFYHYAGVAGGRGRGDDILRVEGINLGGHADSTVADIIAAGYPYDQWAGHFYQAMTQERFVKLGIEAARLGLRVNCVVSRDLEYALSAYEAIDKEVPIRDRRWVVIHVNQASDAQIRRMKTLGVIATVVPAEVEAVLTQHPGVRDAAVIGLKDDDLGRRVHALIEPADADAPPALEELDAHLRLHLASYKLPRGYEIVAMLPRDEAGKIRRSKLRHERGG